MRNWQILLFVGWVGAQFYFAEPLAAQRGGAAEEVVRAFRAMDELPRTIPYHNPRKIDPAGGHIQGVQSLKVGGREYIFLSGSSAAYAYCAVMTRGRKNEVLAVHKILEKPFKHAGGFQISESYLAIGIEDDEAKDKSLIHVYRIDNPEGTLPPPRAVIERAGPPKRSTAGCVGIVTVDQKMLLVVGDWDSRHLDVYVSDVPASATQPLTFELVSTIDVEAVNKTDWINPQWLSYQNINLLKDKESNVYLVGLGRDGQDQDIADLFQLEMDASASYQLKKVATKTFLAPHGTSFQWGAGFQYDQAENQMKILSCTAHLDEEAVINEYR